MATRGDRDESLGELERAAVFRAALRRFLARTDEVAGTAGLTSQRYDLLLAIKTGAGGTSTVTDLASRLSLRQTAVTELVKRAVEAGLVERSLSASDGRVSLLSLTREGERRLIEAFVGLREERSQLAETLRAVGTSFRALARSQDEAAAADGTGRSGRALVVDPAHEPPAVDSPRR